MKKFYQVLLLLVLVSFVPFFSARAENTTQDSPVVVGATLLSTEGTSSPAALPDFEITEVIAKPAASESAAKNYYLTVVNRGGDFLLSSDNALGLSFRNDSSVNSTENASYYSVGVAGDNFAKDQKMAVGPLLVATDGIHVVRAIINPLFTIAEKKYDNNFYQHEVRVGVPAINATSTEGTAPKASTTPEIAKPKSTSTPPVVSKPKFDLKKEASLIASSGSSSDKLLSLVRELKVARNNQAMTENMNKFTETLRKQFPKEAVMKFYAINNFITYGSASTVKLSAKDRYNQVVNFIKTNKKLPGTETDWAKVLEGKK